MPANERLVVQVDAIGNFSNVIGEVGKFRTQLQNLKLPDKLTAKLEKGFDNVESKVTHFQSLLNKGITTKGDFSKLMSSARAADKALVDLKEDVRAIGDKDLHIAVTNSAEIQKAEQALNKLINAGDKLKNFGTSKGTGIIGESEVAKIQKLANTSEGLKKKFQDVDKAFKTGNIEQASAAIEKLIAHVRRYQNQMNNSKSTPGKGDEVLKWATNVRQALNGMVSEVEKARVSLNQLQSNKFEQMKGSINNIATGLGNATNGVRQFINAETEAAARTNQLNEQVGHLRTQANYFFGLQNMGRLIARGIREAAESVRDLDKAMTETAVVTDFSVNDMWKMLPEYTALANKLGATTQGAYETMTLYFQQGLNKQQTFEIGEETMKMARIAGLDYAQTTNMMTAALRGFNMELNQTSAKRVNDVYSELAAITASDTRELGLAMERTASIAHSAGMDFGNTTAFLAQMIETTREAPENLGTAMKTIIARFQELKQNPYEISEVEGEEVDFNRVDKALKSIGVDLMDNRDKFRDLDDVFMDISSRWDGLSQTQQRYIATIAAGARQQSRFLAMVQNYDRLKQLTDAAANSEGASEVQFAKTLESYEAKVNKLKNAWQQYTMELANNQAIKKAIDWLKTIIEYGNKIVKAFGKVGSVFGDVGQGLGEMAASFGLGALGFKGLRGGANLGLKLLGGMTVKGATAGSGMFPSRERGSAGFASKISNPIVAAINRLTSVVSGQASKMPSFQNARQRSDLIKERRQNLYGVTKETTSKLTQPGSLENTIFGSQRYKKKTKAFNASDIRRQFSGLNSIEQKQIYKSIPAIRKALQNGYVEAYKGLNLNEAGQQALAKHFKQVDDAVKSGKISATDAFRHLYNPASVAQAIDNPEVTKALNNAIEQQMKNWGTQKHAKISARLKQMADERGLTGGERQQFYRGQKRQIAGQELGISNKSTAQLGKVAGAMTAISSKAAMAGQSVMGLGMALDSIGMHGTGAALTTVGNGLIGIGMAAEGASAGADKLKEVFGFLRKNPMGAGVAGFAAIGVAVAGGFAIAHKKMVKDAQEAGKKVVDTYKDTADKTEKELKKISEYKENWDTWSAGVDENGNNVSLGTSEYEDYLKAVKEITQAHPELIKGYNALGNAIVDNNTVLEKAKKLAQDEANDAKKDYLTPESYEKIKTRQKSTKRWQNANEGSGVEKILLGKAAAPTYKVQAQEALDALRQIDGADKILKDFGVTWDKTGNITEQGIELIRTKGNDLVNAIKADVGDSDKELNKLVTGASDKVAAFGKTVKDLEDVSKDTYDWGIEYASSKGYDQIDSGLIAPFQTAVERLAEKGLDASEFTNQIDIIGQKYQDLGGALQVFKGVQDDVEKAQEKFGKNLDAEGYKSEVNNLTKPLDAWIKKLKNSADEADRILGEYLENQKAKMLDISESVGTIGDAFNTMSGSMAAAQTVYENWQKQNEGGDLYTPAEEMKKMYEEVHDGVDNLDKGSNQYWSAMEAIVGSDNVWGHSKKEVEDYAKTVMTFFEDGKKGATNFKNYLASDDVQDIKLDTEIFGFKKGNEPFTVSDFIKKVDGGVDLSGLSELGSKELDAFGEAVVGSAETWAAAMMKASQHYDVIFGSAKQMREAIGASEYALAGEGYDGENRHLYFRRDQFREEGRNQNLNKDQIERLEKEVEDEYGIILTDGVKEMSKKMPEYFKDWGITNKKGQTDTSSFIKYLDKLQYNQDEISQLYNQAIDDKLISDANKVDFNEEYKKAIASNRDPSVAAATNIDSNVGSILGVVQSIAVAMGVLTAETKNNVKEGVEESKEAASDLKNGKEGLSYEDARARLYAEDQKLRETKAQLEAGQLNYKEGSPKWEEYAEQIGLINDQIKNNHAIWKSMTEDAYYKAQELDSYSNLIQTKAGEKALSYYNQNGLGNTNLENRNANAIEWGKDPSKGGTSKDWKNLQTWQERFGPINKEDFIGTKSTYYSMADHYGKTGKGQGVELAFTPIFQTDDQKLHVLAEDTADKYLNAIVEASTRKDGTVDIQKLMGLDQEGLEGFTAYGEQIHGLLMGAFTGDGAASAAGAMGQLEHIFSEVVPSGITGFTELSAAASQVSTDATALGNNITKAGGDGEAAASSMKMAFIEANKDGIAKLAKESPAQFQTLTKQLGLTEQELDKIADIHPEINIKAEKLEDTDKKLKDLTGKDHKIKATVESPSNKLPSFKGGDKDAQGQYKEFLKNGVPKETEQDLSVKYKPKIDNEGDVKNTLLSKLKKIFSSVESKPQTVKVKTNTQTSNKTETKTKETKTRTINYKSGKLPTIKDTTSIGLHYKLKKQDDPKKKSANVNYTLGKQAEPKDKHAKVIYDQKAKGQNNKLPNNSGLSFGSAARGVRGTLGPKNKGGLTLTGEEGFEIAWLPGENRSTILGANGPQMLNLPKDAIVYNHRQSKDIIKRKSIPAGSMLGGSMTDKGGSSIRKKTTSGSSGGSSKSSKKKSGKKGKDKDKQNTAAAAKVIQTAGKINLWWWNMTKKVEATQRKIDQAATEFNKAISKFGATTTSLADVINNYRKPLDLQKTYNTTMVNKADSELNVLDYGNKSVDKKVKKAQKKVNKAQKKYNKKKTKSNKKALDKAKKQLNSAKTGLNYETISYDVTEKKTTGKGKKKKTTSKKVTKKSRVNLAPYITFDTKSGAYQVDYQKINKAFGKNKSKATAVGEAAKKKIEDLQSKKNTAEDNIIKAQEALEELGKKVSETFFQWENELTEVYNLTQQIANLSSFADRFDSQIELGLSKLSAGFGDTISTITDAQSVLSKKNNTIQNQVTVQQQMIDARQRELDRMLSSADEQALINKFTNMSEALAGGKEAKQANIDFAKDQKTAADMALSYLKNVKREADGSVTYEIDWKAFEAARYSTTISNVTYEKIKKYLDDLNSAATEFNDSIKTQTDFIKQTYDALKEYQDYIVDFEDTVIKSVEEEITKETQNAKKISDSIRDNLKKLLDEVKNKLDERRKQEDNLKTEQDIAQKQQHLAALRADTSGGHQVEIAQLEKEIADAQQSYQRTLEDQLLDRLQQQADQAAEQRDRLIELQEATNKLSEESNRELVNMWLKDPDKYKEELKAAWLEAQGYDEKGIAGQATLLNQWKSVYTELTTAIKQSGFDSENGIFQATANNTDTLVNLVSLLVKGQAEANVTTRNTKSIDSYEISAESAKILKEDYNLSAKQLAEYGYKAEHLIGDANNPTFSAKEVKDTGYFSATDLKNAGINTAAALHEAGFNATEVKNAGFNSVAALKGGNFTAQEVKSAGFSNISDYINNYNAAEAGTAFSLYELSTSGNKAYAEHAYWEYLKAAAGDGGTSSDELKQVKAYAERAGYAHGEWVPHFAAVDGKGGVTWVKILKILKSWKWNAGRMALTWRNNQTFINAMNTVYKEYAKKNRRGQVTQSAFEVLLQYAKSHNLKAYKTGGLATQTGPAWLDGTPSKPELVLNPTDTKNFLALKDVLSNALSSTKSIENTYGGDTSYEININVDHLNNDYDVDKVAERVKRIIVKDAGYRNVTQVRNFR